MHGTTIGEASQQERKPRQPSVDRCSVASNAYFGIRKSSLHFVLQAAVCNLRPHLDEFLSVIDDSTSFPFSCDFHNVCREDA